MSSKLQVKAELLAYAMARAIVDTLNERFQGRKAQMTAIATGQHKVTGSKTFEVGPEGEAPFGHITIPVSHAKFIVDDYDKFAAWVDQHYGPDHVEYKTVVRPATQKAILEKGLIDKGDGKVGWFNQETGEIIDVPGVSYDKGGQPGSPSFKWAKGTDTIPDGQERALDMLFGSVEGTRAVVEQVLAIPPMPDDQDEDGPGGDTPADGEGDIVEGVVVEDEQVAA